MTDYYVDPAATGLNDGSSWTNAWVSIQTAFDTVTAGNTCYCRGTQTLAAQIDIDTQTGSATTGYIKFVGCNASGAVDGTYFTLDGNSAATYCLVPTNVSNFYFLQNFKITSATSHGIFAASNSTNNWVFNHCAFINNGGHGIYGYRLYLCFYISCLFEDNGSSGVMSAASTAHFIFCVFRGNGGHGILAYFTNLIFGCLNFDNTLDGISLGAQSIVSINSIYHANGDTGIVTSCPNLLLGNRFTGHNSAGEAGVNLDSEVALLGYNYFDSNTTNLLNATLKHTFSGDGQGSDTNQEDTVGETDYGYTSLTAGSEDFNLRSDATLRRVAIPIPDAN